MKPSLAFCVLAFGALSPAQVVHRPWSPYAPPRTTPVSMSNSPRLASLMRAGNVYLSLDDAIALALENNLDIELQRFAPAIAQSDLERTKGGASSVRGIPLTVNLLPQGIGGPASPLLNLPASGITPATSVPTSLIEQAAIVAGQTSANIAGTISAGPLAPQYDPAVVGNLNWQRQSTPEANPFIVGANALSLRNVTGSAGLAKGFSWGTQFGASFNSLSQSTNSLRTLYNPNNLSNLGLTLTQPLLRGFGPGVNRRFIRIARNDRQLSDLVFRQQAIETVAGVIRLYFDLVSLAEDVQVKRQTLALAEQLHADNKAKVDQGTLAPIELVRAQALIAAARQDLANSEGFERQQELIVKTVLSRRGTADPALREARVVTTTSVDVPVSDETRPVQDLVQEAIGRRPELHAGRLQIENSRIAMAGSRNELLPQIDLIAAAQNSGLAGQLNPVAQSGTAASGLTVQPNPEFIGGFGSAASQIFRGSYPTYGIGIQLTLPIRNRVAQGDYARDEITLRQTEVRMQQLENQVRLEVEGAVIALERSRAAYEAAVQARALQEQSLAIEQEKYANALSTPFLVMQYQTYVAQARSTEVAARAAYAKARTILERAVGETLENHGISIEDVYRGRITREPARLPGTSSK